MFVIMSLDEFHSGCCYFLRPCGRWSVLKVTALVIVVVFAACIGAVAGIMGSIILGRHSSRQILQGAGFGIPFGLVFGILIIILHVIYMHTCRRTRGNYTRLQVNA